MLRNGEIIGAYRAYALRSEGGTLARRSGESHLKSYWQSEEPGAMLQRDHFCTRQFLISAT